MKKLITIYIEGGCVTDVINMPQGYKYQICDRDNDDNTCDKCGDAHNTELLVWISAEGFRPKRGEIVPQSAYNKYSALCVPCYYKVIGKK